MGKNTIPDRWLSYSAVGQQISGTRFITFKVPLKMQLSNKVSVEERFLPEMLVEKIPNLKCVIDLTNTNRYYDPLEFTKHNIQYVKIPCVGRELPSSSTIRRFFEVVDRFLKDNEDGLIGIHCTHGVNRTGYFVCRYMVDRMGFEPQQAISIFNEARGHKMERPVYLNDLKRMYNDDHSPKSYDDHYSDSSRYKDYDRSFRKQSSKYHESIPSKLYSNGETPSYPDHYQFAPANYDYQYNPYQPPYNQTPYTQSPYNQLPYSQPYEYQNELPPQSVYSSSASAYQQPYVNPYSPTPFDPSIPERQPYSMPVPIPQRQSLEQPSSNPNSTRFQPPHPSTSLDRNSRERQSYSPPRQAFKRKSSVDRHGPPKHYNFKKPLVYDPRPSISKDSRKHKESSRSKRSKSPEQKTYKSKYYVNSALKNRHKQLNEASSRKDIQDTKR